MLGTGGTVRVLWIVGQGESTGEWNWVTGGFAMENWGAPSELEIVLDVNPGAVLRFALGWYGVGLWPRRMGDLKFEISEWEPE